MENILNSKWMKSSIITCLSCFILLITTVSCKENKEYTKENKEYTNVFVGEPTGTKLEAMGAELDPHFFLKI